VKKRRERTEEQAKKFENEIYERKISELKKKHGVINRKKIVIK
jgi:hypothetical protein